MLNVTVFIVAVRLIKCKEDNMKELQLKNNLKKLRKKYNITQKELAKKIDVTTSSVGMYESGARKPSIEVLLKIVDYFDVSIDCLLTSKIIF